MATTSQGAIARHQLGFIRAGIDATVNAGAINASDLVYFTANAGAASFGSGPLTLNAALVAQLAKLLGVSKDTNPLLGGIQNPLLDIGIYTFGEQPFNTTNGDTYTHLAPVTIGTDAQTITLAPVPAAPTCALSATAASALNGLAAAQHGVTLAWVTAMGKTTCGPATNGATTLTTGGDPSISVTVPALPAYAIGCAIYVDGILAEVVSAAGTYTVSGYSAALDAAPLEHALAIGYAYMPLSTSTPGAPTASIAGGSGVTLNVRLRQIYPQHNGLI